MKKINNSTNENLTEVYKDSKGNRWFTLKEPKDISASRGIQAALAERYMSLMISKKEFDLALQAHSQSAKDNDIVNCFAIIADLKYRSKFICEANSVLDLASVYYFLIDEDPEEYSEVIADKKQKIWAEDPTCKSFFLRLGLNLTTQFANTPEEDLIKFMEETKMVADRIYRHIPSPMMR